MGVFMLRINQFFVGLAFISGFNFSFVQAQTPIQNTSVFISTDTSVASIAELFYANTAAMPLNKAMTIRGIAPQQQDNRCVMQDGTIQSQNSRAKRFALVAGQNSNESINTAPTTGNSNSNSNSTNNVSTASTQNNNQAIPATAEQIVPVVDRPVSSVNLALNFGLDSDKLSDKDKLLLKNVAEAMNEIQLKRVLFAVVGHTDNSGARNYNLELSCSRAFIVSQYLAALGVNPNRITAYGFGPDQPIEKSAGVNAKNRRVEIRRAN